MKYEILDQKNCHNIINIEIKKIALINTCFLEITNYWSGKLNKKKTQDYNNIIVRRVKIIHFLSIIILFKIWWV